MWLICLNAFFYDVTSIVSKKFAGNIIFTLVKYRRVLQVKVRCYTVIVHSISYTLFQLFNYKQNMIIIHQHFHYINNSFSIML